MATEAAADDAQDDPAPEPAASAPPRAAPKGRKLLFGGIAALILTAAATGGYMFVARGAEATLLTESSAEAYVEVPPMTVNLRVPGGQARFLKLRFIIVAASPAQSDAIRGRLPILLDALQPFLRELRPEDLNGSAAVFRIKEEMMVRARSTYGDGVVRDLLIQDLVQQ